MTRAWLFRLALSAWAPAANGCSGYADGSALAAAASDAGTDVPAKRTAPARPADAPPELEPLPEAEPEVKPAEPTPEPEPRPAEPAPTPVDPPVQQPPAETPPRDANLLLARSASFDGYLTDRLGNALYMYAGDMTGVADSACLGDCAREWPPFDLEHARPGPGIDPAEISRFHRQDGPWQTTYKGHALYYRAREAGSGEVTGDGVDKRWFVARDYLAFLSSARTFAPTGGNAANATFLTDGFGRALYVCLNDQPRTRESEAISSCDSACTVQRPIFAAAETARTTLLPSVISPLELSELVRPDGQRQLTYRGWPLYYYGGDAVAGATEGHNDRAWRAIDPVTFGLMPEADSGN